MIVTFSALRGTLGPWSIVSPQYASMKAWVLVDSSAQRGLVIVANTAGYGELIGRSTYNAIASCISRLGSTVDPSLAG